MDTSTSLLVERENTVWITLENDEKKVKKSKFNLNTIAIFDFFKKAFKYLILNHSIMNRKFREDDSLMNKMAIAALGLGAAYLMRSKESREKLMKQVESFTGMATQSEGK